MRNRHARCGSHRGRQRRGKDKPAGKAADKVTERHGPRDITANHTVGFAQGALNQCNAIRNAVAFRHTTTARPIEAHGMHLIEIGHGAVFFGNIDDRLNRGHVTVHGIDALKGDDLGHIGRQAAQLGL